LEVDMQHPDEGTIHAWLDGALAPNEASAVEAHVQTCAECAQAVAEARGLVAASSRILAALDDVPALQQPRAIPLPRRRGVAWWRRAGVSYAAAATVLLAAGTTLVLRVMSPDAALDSAPRAVDESAAPLQSPQPAALRDSAGSALRVVPPTTQRSATSGAAAPPPNAAGAERAKNTVEAEAKKEELAVDRIVPLPGPMPRPAAPAHAPKVRQEERKAVANLAADIAAPARGAVVQGRVLDAATGAPVVGAEVSVDTARMAARTDSAGKFKLQSVPLGQQTVSVRALGFQSVQHQVAVEPRDSVDLGFALKKTSLQEQQVAVTSAPGAQSQRARRDSVALPARTASPILRLDGQRAAGASIFTCYTLRAVGAQDKDEARALARSLPARVLLEGQLQERAQASEAIMNRARTLEGTGRAESWRTVGDSLELTWFDGTSRTTLRFARSGSRWVSSTAVMELCPAAPR
jgi:anti-sigma factor RsiW